jgi:hypothetical protein
MKANPITLPSWTAHGDEFASLHVNDARHPLQYRLYWLACKRANVAGHAEFGVGQLCQALVIADAQGVAHLPSKAAVSKAIKRAKELGLLHSSSDARCLVLPPYGVQRGGTGSASCAHHGVGKFAR